MLISHICKFIYLKTRKTGGTSVEIFFEPYCVDPKLYAGERHAREQLVSSWGIVGSRGSANAAWSNHMSGERVHELAGEEVWNSYRKFCVVRNPFDKVVSWFWHTASDGLREDLARADFSQVRKNFDAWTSRLDFPADRFIYYAGETVLVDEFIRYEKLQDDLMALCGRLEIPWQPERLGRYKSGFRKRRENFAEYYTPDASRRVAEEFAWELEYFRYSQAS